MGLDSLAFVTLWTLYPSICQTRHMARLTTPATYPPPRRTSSPKGLDAPLGRVLTENELRFAREYCVDHNATRAYQRAYPNTSYATAATQGYRLLKKPRVAAEVAAAEREHLRATGVTAKRVLRELAAIAFHDPVDVFESGSEGAPVPRAWGAISPRARRAIQSVKVRRKRVEGGDGQAWVVEEIDLRFHSKLDALSQLAKHLGLTQDGAVLRDVLDALSQRPADRAERV